MIALLILGIAIPTHVAANSTYFPATSAQAVQQWDVVAMQGSCLAVVTEAKGGGIEFHGRYIDAQKLGADAIDLTVDFDYGRVKFRGGLGTLIPYGNTPTSDPKKQGLGVRFVVPAGHPINVEISGGCGNSGFGFTVWAGDPQQPCIRYVMPGQKVSTAPKCVAPVNYSNIGNAKGKLTNPGNPIGNPSSSSKQTITQQNNSCKYYAEFASLFRSPSGQMSTRSQWVPEQVNGCEFHAKLDPSGPTQLVFTYQKSMVINTPTYPNGSGLPSGGLEYASDATVYNATPQATASNNSNSAAPVATATPVATQAPSTASTLAVTTALAWCNNSACTAGEFTPLVESNGYTNPAGLKFTATNTNNCPSFTLPSGATMDYNGGNGITGPTTVNNVCVASLRLAA